jgi:D-3-phosphoglycerate dehydrogenase
MKTILVNRPIHISALERLRQEAKVLTPYGASRDELLDLLPRINAVILAAGLTMGPEEMDLAERLEVIGRHGAGLDIVDITAATERGIPVVFTPFGPTESTAEHALLLILAAARRLSQIDRAVRSGDFAIRDRVLGRELEGLSLGVVGFGRIGRRLAEMCRDALHMQIYVFDPYVDPAAVAEWGAVLVADLIQMADQVDILSIHAPLTDETRHLVNRDVIRALGPTGILVNASRGALVDEGALIEALQQGALGGAGLDVYDPEPPSPLNPLFAMDSVVLTPHMGSATDEGRRNMGLTVAEDTLRVLRGEEPQYLVNPEAWTRRRIVV